MQYSRRYFCLITAVIILIMSIGGNIIHAESDTENNEYVIFSERDNIKSQDMRKKSQVTEEQLRTYLQRFPSLSGIEGALTEAQDKYNVNAILILAIIRLESGNSRSSLAKNNNNLGGIVAPSGSVAAYRSFDSKGDCVIFMARLLSEHYLTEGGRFFNGYTLTDINKKYSASNTWTAKVSDIMYEIQWRLSE